MPKAFSGAVLDSYRPRLIPLTGNLVAASFPLMKIFPAEFCIRRAREEGSINSNSLIMETSSGNMALGLVVVSKLYGYSPVIVSDYACDYAFRRRLEDLGARVEIVPAPLQKGGYQQARLERLIEICGENPNHFRVNQYDNPCNPGAYSFLASELVKTLGRVDCLVGTVGSGGSVCGTSGYLRQLFPEMITIGVDTFRSVLFGQSDGPRQLRGLGNSILPKNLDHTIFDEVHWVTAAEAYKATRTLHQRTSLFCGGTSGAAWMVARYWAMKNPKARVVCILPDDGYRYIDTIYNDEYLCKNGLCIPALPKGPREVTVPEDAHTCWSRMYWLRRRYEDVVTKELAAAP